MIIAGSSQAENYRETETQKKPEGEQTKYMIDAYVSRHSSPVTICPLVKKEQGGLRPPIIMKDLRGMS